MCDVSSLTEKPAKKAFQAFTCTFDLYYHFGTFLVAWCCENHSKLLIPIVHYEIYLVCFSIVQTKEIIHKKRVGLCFSLGY